jgi:membrane associated rhomboid family serine protease
MSAMTRSAPRMRYDNSWSGGGFDIRRMRLWPATYWLIVVNIGVFVAQVASGDLVTQWGSFSIATAIRGYQIWRFVTFQFLHADVLHLAFNMIALYIFGRIVENRLGAKRYLAFYLLCGICGAVVFLLLWKLGFLSRDPYQPMVGASAGIFGLLVAVLNIAPRMVVRYVFPPMVMRLRTLALIFIGLAILTILSRGENAGGEAAHLGGALGGWILITNVGWLNWFDRSKRRQRFWRPGDPASNFFRQP